MARAVREGGEPRLGRADALGQARAVGEARGLEVQQIDTGAFRDDERQHRWLAGSGFERVRTWWQMTRPVTAEEASLTDSPDHWEKGGVRFRLVRRSARVVRSWASRLARCVASVARRSFCAVARASPSIPAMTSSSDVAPRITASGSGSPWM